MKPIDLERGVVPISKAASCLAALIKRARADQQPIIITQKGYPSGVLLGIELFTALQDLAARHVRANGEPEEA
jgi:prevent-host-death family protein